MRTQYEGESITKFVPFKLLAEENKAPDIENDASEGAADEMTCEIVDSDEDDAKDKGHQATAEEEED